MCPQSSKLDQPIEQPATVDHRREIFAQCPTTSHANNGVFCKIDRKVAFGSVNVTRKELISAYRSRSRTITWDSYYKNFIGARPNWHTVVSDGEVELEVFLQETFVCPYCCETQTVQHWFLHRFLVASDPLKEQQLVTKEVTLIRSEATGESTPVPVFCESCRHLAPSVTTQRTGAGPRQVLVQELKEELVRLDNEVTECRADLKATAKHRSVSQLLGVGSRLAFLWGTVAIVTRIYGYFDQFFVRSVFHSMIRSVQQYPVLSACLIAFGGVTTASRLWRFTGGEFWCNNTAALLKKRQLDLDKARAELQRVLNLSDKAAFEELIERLKPENTDASGFDIQWEEAGTFVTSTNQHPA